MTRPLNLRFQVNYDHLAAAAVTLAPILYFLPAVLYGKVLCSADGILQNVPFRVTAGQMIRSGYLPLWNPYIFSGTPFMASAQVGLLFPLNWFYVFFSPIAATNLMVISSYMVAALGAYLFARQSDASVTGAVVTSLIWQWSGHLIGEIGHINIVHTAAMLPWILWSIEYFAAGAQQRRGFLIAVFVAIQLFAGHHQTFVYSLLLVGAYGLVMAIIKVEARKRYLGSLAYAGGGILLAAVQILPTFELLRNSNRASASYDFFTSFSLPPRFVALFVAPYVMGGGDGRLFRAPYFGPPYYPELVGYVGILGLMLAIIAFVIKRDARTKFWAVVTIAALLLAFGRYAPLDFYRLIYFVPLLNLFRVPARHLMVVDFALAVLAGRGVTALMIGGRDPRVIKRVVIVAAVVFVLTLLTVTALRPSAFRLGREAPVSLLRAPELFLPILTAGASAVSLWLFVQKRRGAAILMIAVLAFDLGVWGQSSGWHTGSLQRDEAYWLAPEPVQALRTIAPKDHYRILTAQHAFDPALPVALGPTLDHSLWTQPDVYMLHGFQNAAGYDGFRLERYSKIAGQMKVWGELMNPDTTLRGDSREIDLLNVRYLLSAPKTPNLVPTPADTFFAPATEQLGNSMFASTELGLSGISREKHISLSFPPVFIDRIALVTHLAWSEHVNDKTAVGRVRLKTSDGRRLEVPLLAGVDTAEWAYDRRDIRARIRHQRPAVATSFEVNDASGNYQGHTFLTTIALPERAEISGGEILLEPQATAPDLSLAVFRITLVDSSSGQTYALPRHAATVETFGDSHESPIARWKLLKQTAVDIYENTRALPRAWLAPEGRVLIETDTLEVIRAGKFADGTKWDPAGTALIDPSIGNLSGGGASGQASITLYEPNRIVITTKSDSDQILVLSENHYPGWRAYVDGRAVETLRVNYNLRGAIVPAGQHQVEFVYRPKSVLIGLVISLLSALGLTFGSGIRRRIFRRRAR